MGEYMSEYEIVFYMNDKGEKPVVKFLDSLDDKMRAKMLLSIRIIKENGPMIRLPFPKNLKMESSN